MNRNLRNLHGRASEIACARDFLSRVSDTGTGNSGGVIVLGGPSGAGKTALADAILAEAGELGYDCYQTACEPFHEGMSYFPIRELVRQIARGRNVGEVIGELFGPLSPQVEMAAVSESLAADPGSRREAIVATFTNVILGSYKNQETQPILLFIDDLEHLDAGSADALICLISRLSEGRVVLIGAYRTDLVASAKHPLRAVMGSARRLEGMYQHFEVEGFDEDGFSSLVEALLEGPATLPTPFLKKLYDETEGNPLFTRELLRMLGSPDPRSGRAALRIVEGTWHFDGDVDLWEIPDTVEDVIASRLNLLDTEQRRELELAAVVGRRFAFEVLCGLMDAGEDELLTDLEKFLDFDLIRELDKTDDTFEFSHGKIREVLYSQISGLRRRRLHAQLAQVISNLTRSTNEDWDALIGEHLLLAAKKSEAFPFLLRAARNAQATGAATESATLFRKALDCVTGAVLEGDDSRMTIELELASALIASSAIPEAGNVLQQLLDTNTPAVVRVVAANLHGDALLYEGEVEQALTAYEESRRLALTLGDTEALCEVLCDLSELHGRQYERLSGLSSAVAQQHRRLYVDYVEQAYNLHDVVDGGALRARILRNKAKLARVSGDLSGAEDLYRRAIEASDARVSGHRFLVPYAKTLRRAGKTDQALETIERVLTWSSQVGSVRSQAIALQYKATFLMTRAESDQDIAAATNVAERSMTAHRSIGYAQGLRETGIVLGELALRANEADRAAQWFATSVAGSNLDAPHLYDAVAGELEANGEEDRAFRIRAALELLPDRATSA